MGKRIREKKHDISDGNISHVHTHSHHHHHHPGRVWGILHILKYHHWHRVKKRLTHRKHGGGRNDAKDGIPGTSDDSAIDTMPEHYEPNTKLPRVEEKMVVHSTPPAKHSLKARIKALITEEISRKKCQHKRSSTCPAKSQLNRHDAMHHLDDPLNDLFVTVQSPQPVVGNPHAASPSASASAHTMDVLPPSPFPSEEIPITNNNNNNDKCVDCGTMFCSDTVEHNQVHHRHQKQQWTHITNLRSPNYQGVPEEKLINAKILTTDASPHLFKDFLDALDIINTNKDFLLKYLQAPGSPLPCPYHNKQNNLIGKMRHSRSVSFPLSAGSCCSSSSSTSGVKDSDPAGPQLINKMVDDLFNAKGERQSQNQIHIQNVSESENEKSSEDFHQQSSPIISSGSTSSSVLPQVPSHVASKHFKELRKKIRHLIAESKNERHRITMDAVLDKIPHGIKPNSKNAKKLMMIPEQSKDPTLIDGEGSKDSSTNSTGGYGHRLSSFSFNKRQLSSMRTTSLKESVGRYSQLYETCFNREVKYPKTDKLKLKTQERSSILKTPKSFQRFLSMPNLQSDFNQGGEEPSVLLSPQNSIKQIGERTTTSISVTDERRSFGHNDSSISNSQVLPHCYSFADNTIQESSLNIGEKKLLVEDRSRVEKPGSDVYNEEKENRGINFDGLGNSVENEVAACNEQDTGPMVESKSASLSDYSFLDDIIDFDKLNLLEDTELMPEVADDQQQMDYPEVARIGDNFQKFGILSKRFNYEIPSIEVDPSNDAEFKYVRDVLEISGFTGHESLGIWYSDDQPVDPLVYEELEGCLLFGPDCSGNCNEGGQCNHLLLFDLINEGLLEIFGRSYTYYPKPLSYLSHVHPLPEGNHVLHKVWTLISWYLNSTSEVYPSLDYYVSRDLARNDGWMNLQFDSECVGLELDDLIFDDLLEEIICT